MKCTAILDSKTYELECLNVPTVHFEEVEVLTPTGTSFVLGSHSWNKLQCENIPPELISEDEFTILMRIDDNTYHQITGCRIMKDGKSIFFRNAIIRLTKHRFDDLLEANVGQLLSLSAD